MKKEVDFVERYLIEFGLRATFTGNLYHIRNEMISFFREVKQNKAILEYIALVIEVNEHYSITMNDIATLSHTIQKEMHNNASIWLDVQLSSSLINKGFRVSVYYLTEH